LLSRPGSCRRRSRAAAAAAAGPRRAHAGEFPTSTSAIPMP
jgi:hypothetical protein